MADDKKQNKKASDSKLDVVKTTVKVDIGASTKINPLHTTMVNPLHTAMVGSNESILGLNHALITGAEIIKNNSDIAGEAYKKLNSLIQPIDVGTNHLAVKIGTRAEDFMGGHSTMVNNIPIVTSRRSDSVFGLENNIVFPAFVPGRNLNEGVTKEEVEKLIEKKLPSKKDDGLKKEQVIEIFNEITENRNKKENENILIVNKNGLDFITKELLAGKERDWRCAKCGKPLEIFKGEEGIEKIKKYLVDFRNNISKKCANGHDNWFELKEDGINWIVKVIYEKEFRLKS
jgi:hypothetical protein